MLNKELIRARSAGNYIKPQFVRTDDPGLLELAKDLLAVFEESAGESREYIAGLTDPCVNAMKDVKLARGILKVIQDKSEYSAVTDRDWRALRKQVFLASAQALKSGDLPPDFQDFRPRVLQTVEPDLPSLYADLPEKELLLKSRPMYPREVLERYNMYLVQSLLFYTEKLELLFPADENPQLIRSLFQCLRFFRLLARAERKGNNISMTVEGPASLFENTTKYAMQTASFFPVVCRLAHWKAACTVTLAKTPRRLLLDQDTGLVCHYRNLASWMPEEIRLFADYFRKEQSVWTLDDAPGFMMCGRDMIIPDFAFRREGECFCLELFHRWHLTQLKKRLEQEESGVLRNLLIGVDRSLLKQDGVLKEQLENSPYFRKCGFFFRDFPGKENVEKLLAAQNGLF